MGGEDVDVGGVVGLLVGLVGVEGHCIYGGQLGVLAGWLVEVDFLVDVDDPVGRQGLSSELCTPHLYAS